MEIRNIENLTAVDRVYDRDWPNTSTFPLTKPTLN